MATAERGSQGDGGKNVKNEGVVVFVFVRRLTSVPGYHIVHARHACVSQCRDAEVHM